MAKKYERLDPRPINTTLTSNTQNTAVFEVMTHLTSYDQMNKRFMLASSAQEVMARYLPREVSELMVYYLWLILPFRHHLESLTLKNSSVPSSMLWCIDSKRWDGERVRRIFGRESNEINSKYQSISTCGDSDGT